MEAVDADRYQQEGIICPFKMVTAQVPISMHCARCSVHTGIEPPFLLKIYYAITACMTQGFTFRKYSV